MMYQKKGLSRNISNVRKDEGWDLEKGANHVD